MTTTSRRRFPVRSRRAIALIIVLAIIVLITAWWTVSVFRTSGWLLLSSQLAWRFTPRWAALVAALIVILSLLCTHWASRLSADTPERPTPAELAALDAPDRSRRIREFRRSGLKGFVVGGDGRTSTSQVQVVIWSLALAFGLLFLLLLVGRSPNCPAAATGRHFGSCPKNAMTGVSFADLLGKNFRWEYLFLLGWPLALAVYAKQQVFKALDDIDAETGAAEDTSKPKAGSPEAVGTSQGAQVKAPPTDAASVGVIAGLRDVVSDDHGRGALLDAQYFTFTLITAVYFVLQVTTHPKSGLPEIPAALLVLMGVAGGGYLSSKVLDPVGAKSERKVPPPPVTPATTEAAEDLERAAAEPDRTAARSPTGAPLPSTAPSVTSGTPGLPSKETATSTEASVAASSAESTAQSVDGHDAERRDEPSPPAPATHDERAADGQQTAGMETGTNR
jgi:hypothetical protein